ncbi:MAG: putative short chain dehydrogenase [Acidimicrobiia bacterium]|nr:putative short chain dehydrogenase [Acidimicrobiia bacterium]
MQLEAGQVAVITGGASGIGAALAAAFADRGLSVVLCDVEDGALQRAAARIQERGGEALGLKVDVTDLDQMRRAAEQTLERFGRIDVICNNAGVVAAMKPMWEFDPADWAWVMNVNLWGVINGISAFVPHLVQQGHGHVLNTSSMAGIATVPFLGPYTASKHAVVGLSESLSAELAERAPGVGVTVMCPGFVATRLADAERNRPGSAVPPGAVDTDAPSPAMASGVDAASVAREAIAAIEANRLHVAPGPGNRPRIAQRIDLLLADLDS